MTVVATGTRKSTEEDKQRIRELMGEEAVMLEEGNARTLLDVVYRYQADLMIAGGRNMYTAYKPGCRFSISIRSANTPSPARGSSPSPASCVRPSTVPSGRKPMPAPRGTKEYTMADIFRTDKPLAVSLIRPASRSAQSSPASGLNTASLWSTAREGCSAFAKVFFIQHFHDPVPLQSTAMDPTSTIMGADGNIFTALDTSASATRRRLSCCSAPGCLRLRAATFPRGSPVSRRVSPAQGVAILTVNAGFFMVPWKTASARCSSVIEQWVAPTPRPAQRNRRVNLLVSHLCSPGDISGCADASKPLVCSR